MAERIAGPEIERLIQLLARLPGLGPRSARRAALHLIRKREELLGPLAEAMRVAKDKIVTCSVCGNIDTSDPCSICADKRRDPSTIVVVETIGDLWALERAGVMKRPISRARRRPVAARRRRPGRSQSRKTGRAGGRRRRQGSDPGGQRHGGWPDHGPLHHRYFGHSRSNAAASPMASRSAASWIISTKARWRRR